MIKGYLDNLLFSIRSGWVLNGWAADTNRFGTPLEIDVVHNGGVIATGIANQYREDLKAGGIGEGFHGFSLPLPPELLKQTQSLELSMKIAGHDIPVGEPCVFRPNSITGWLDKVEGIVVSGWAFNAADPETPLSVDMLLDGELIDRVIADQYREDLSQCGTGNYGFQWLIPEAFADGQTRRISARITNQSVFLSGELLDITIVPGQLTPETRRRLFQRRAAIQQIRSLDQLLYAEGRWLKAGEVITVVDLLLDRFPLPPDLEGTHMPEIIVPKTAV